MFDGSAGLIVHSWHVKAASCDLRLEPFTDWAKIGGWGQGSTGRGCIILSDQPYHNLDTHIGDRKNVNHTPTNFIDLQCKKSGFLAWFCHLSKMARV